MGNNKKNYFESGQEVIKIAQKKGCTVRRGKGDHVIIYSPDGHSCMPVVDREMGKGLGAKIFKWCVSVGIVIFIFMVISGWDRILLGFERVFKVLQ
jgi:predicted RNA binding protein YcfA (HicA-like mRNA interferase family)